MLGRVVGYDIDMQMHMMYECLLPLTRKGLLHLNACYLITGIYTACLP